MNSATVQTKHRHRQRLCNTHDGVDDFLLRHFLVELHSNLLEEGEDLSRAEDAPGKNVCHDLGRLGNVIWLATRAPWLASPTWNTTASTVSRLYPSP